MCNVCVDSRSQKHLIVVSNNACVSAYGNFANTNWSFAKQRDSLVFVNYQILFRCVVVARQ